MPSDLMVCTSSDCLKPGSPLKHRKSPLSRAPLPIRRGEGAAGPGAAFVQGEEPRLRVPGHPCVGARRLLVLKGWGVPSYALGPAVHLQAEECWGQA